MKNALCSQYNTVWMWLPKCSALFIIVQIRLSLRLWKYSFLVLLNQESGHVWMSLIESKLRCYLWWHSNYCAFDKHSWQESPSLIFVENAPHKYHFSRWLSPTSSKNNNTKNQQPISPPRQQARGAKVTAHHEALFLS